MEVICKGYKTCSSREWCSHSKPHQFKEYDDYCYTEDDADKDKNSRKCCCDNTSIRKLKLQKIQNGNI